MKLVVCNTEWAVGKKQKMLNEIIFDYSPDIVCATEVKEDFFLNNGNILFLKVIMGITQLESIK